jgi:hypothetical protein
VSARLILLSEKKHILRTTPGTGITRVDTTTVCATAKRRRGQARFDKRFKPKTSNKALGVKTTFIGNTPKKK